MPLKWFLKCAILETVCVFQSVFCLAAGSFQDGASLGHAIPVPIVANPAGSSATSSRVNSNWTSPLLSRTASQAVNTPLASLFRGASNASGVSSGFGSSAPGCSRLAVAAHAGAEAEVNNGSVPNLPRPSVARANSQQGEGVAVGDTLSKSGPEVGVAGVIAGAAAGVQQRLVEALGDGPEQVVCKEEKLWELLQLGDKAFLRCDWEAADGLYQQGLPLSSAHIVAVRKTMRSQ